ncbi:MAG TPA: M36 family metallopeptidase [Vicinamibacterales bacterium]
MRTPFRVFLCLAAVAMCAATAAAQGKRFAVPAARSSQPGGGLPATASPRAALQQLLRAQGRDETTVESVVEQSRTQGRSGVSHARFEQRAAGLTVHGTYAKVALSAEGSLVNVVENLVTVPRAIGRARITQQEAVAAAVANLYPALRTVPPGFFRRTPAATRVAIPFSDGSMSIGYLVETWTQATNELNETLVDGSGAVLEVESRTNRDVYSVFRFNPNVSAQTQTAGPGSGNAESPAGWLFNGVQGSTHITGNNVSAYLDAVSNNKSDGEGDTISSGSFTTAVDLTASPSTSDNREVAVQNLFFLNNVIHDELYRHGFTEAAGNFQENNFGNGGNGKDSVNAEAQDGGGIDNANFATPKDGQNPRMQMYLWTGRGTHQVLAGGQTFLAQGAEFGPALDNAGIAGTIRLVNDGTATTSDGCEASTTSLTGAIALIDRGNCAFTVKVKNAQNAGAVAVIVANNSGESIFLMGGADASITIPAVFIAQSSGNTIKAMLPTSGVVRLSNPPPLSRDGDIDSDVVFHEYCHGLTWRMIGKMSGPLAGAIGEGMSDVCALLLNSTETGADVIGEYSFSDPLGLRRFPYAGYPMTYGDVDGAEVHNDGEIYGAIGWRLFELFGESRKDVLFDYIVDGMNFTPPQPTYEQMRDGILAAVRAAPDDADDECRVWRAFAKFGVGVGAAGAVHGKSVAINESFALPVGCTP